MAVKIPVNTEHGLNFEERPAGPGRVQWVEKVRGGHFWPIFSLLCGLFFLALTGFIVRALATGQLKDGADAGTPPIIFLLLICLLMLAMCLGLPFLHFREYRRKTRHAPATLDLPNPLRGGQPNRLSFGKKLLRPASADQFPGEIRARLELLAFNREAPKNNEDDREDSQGRYSVGLETLWHDTLRPMPVMAGGSFLAEWLLTPPDLFRAGFKPNAMSAHLILTIELRRNNREFLEPYRILLPLE